MVDSGPGFFKKIKNGDKDGCRRSSSCSDRRKERMIGRRKAFAVLASGRPPRSCQVCALFVLFQCHIARSCCPGRNPTRCVWFRPRGTQGRKKGTRGKGRRHSRIERALVERFPYIVMLDAFHFLIKKIWAVK